MDDNDETVTALGGGAGEKVGSRSPQGGRRMGAVTMKLAKTRGGNYDVGGNVVSQKQAVGRLRRQ